MSTTAIDFTARMQAATGVDVEAILHDFRDAADRVAEAGKEIARVKSEMVQLAARHGNGKAGPTHFEWERKAKLSEIMEARRTELQRAGDKVVEGALDSYAHAHPAYLAFLEHARGEKVRLEELNVRLSVAFTELELQKGIREYLSARLDVIRSQMFAYSAEARLS